MAEFALLADRAVLVLEGKDRVAFLQGLTSNDVRRIAADRAIFSALLTAQGKYLHDFFVAGHGGAWLLECEAQRRADLHKRLGLYRLRAKVTLSAGGGAWAVAAAFGTGAAAAFGLTEAPGAAAAFAGGVAYVDPRRAELGVRLMLPAGEAPAALLGAGLAERPAEDYDRHRLAVGVPDGSRDIELEKSTLIEAGYDGLNAISWTKGCWLGQELTARTHYRGLVKRRLVPVRVDGPLPPPGTPILRDGREVGTLRSGRDGAAMALLRLEALEAADGAGDGATAPLTADGAVVVPRRVAGTAEPEPPPEPAGEAGRDGEAG